MLINVWFKVLSLRAFMYGKLIFHSVNQNEIFYLIYVGSQRFFYDCIFYMKRSIKVKVNSEKNQLFGAESCDFNWLSWKVVL